MVEWKPIADLTVNADNRDDFVVVTILYKPPMLLPWYRVVRRKCAFDLIDTNNEANANFYYLEIPSPPEYFCK